MKKMEKNVNYRVGKIDLIKLDLHKELNLFSTSFLSSFVRAIIRVAAVGFNGN